MNNKIRGFEFISENQFNEDFKGLNITYAELTKKRDDGTYIMKPRRGTKKSACYDLFAPCDIILNPNEEIKVPTGIKAYMLDDEVLKAYPRSGHGFKYYVRLANTVGIIDADYIESDNEGHIWVKLRVEGNKKCIIEKGQGMCQVMFHKYLLADGDNFEDGQQRNGGFGSTTK